MLYRSWDSALSDLSSLNESSMVIVFEVLFNSFPTDMLGLKSLEGQSWQLKRRVPVSSETVNRASGYLVCSLSIMASAEAVD